MAVQNPYREGSAKAKAFDLLKSGKPAKTATVVESLRKVVDHPTQALYGMATSKAIAKIGKVTFNPDAGTVQLVFRKGTGSTKKAVSKAKPAPEPVEA